MPAAKAASSGADNPLPTTTETDYPADYNPDAMATPLITGLPSGAGGPIGQANAGTWSALDQYQQFLAADPGLSPVPPPHPNVRSARRR